MADCIIKRGGGDSGNINVTTKCSCAAGWSDTTGSTIDFGEPVIGYCCSYWRHNQDYGTGYLRSYGSNDKSSWTLLNTITGSTYKAYSSVFVTSTEYRYYRCVLNSANALDNLGWCLSVSAIS